MRKPQFSSVDWVKIPMIATVARLLSKELTLANEYLKTENRILKQNIPGRLIFNDDQRRSLTDAALALGRDLMKEVVSIVSPETILAWKRKLEKAKWDYTHKRRRTGRPCKPAEISELVCRLARENTWGYGRIHGEMTKLSIEISRTCIANILRKNNLPISPNQMGLSWKEFLSRHADVMLCTDFFTQEVFSMKGLVTVYCLLIMHLKTRTILLAETTLNPTGEWMSNMARNIMMTCEDHDIVLEKLLHDRDFLFSHGFDPTLRTANIDIIKTSYRSPNLNAFAERSIRSIRTEVLEHYVFFGQQHLQRILDSYKDYFNNHRPHQGINQQLPMEMLSGKMTEDNNTGPVQCREMLGGLLKSYYRTAA